MAEMLDTKNMTRIKNNNSCGATKCDGLDRSDPHSSTFPFLKLPAEIRNMIYKLVLACKHSLFLVPTQERKHQRIIERSRYYRNPQSPSDIHISLLRTCKQTREEAAPIFFSFNHFHFHVAGTLIQFFRKNKKYVHHIRSVTLRIADYSRPVAATAFKELARADQLEYLEIIGKWEIFGQLSIFRHPRHSLKDADFELIRTAAKNFYEASKCWIETVGSRTGNKEAALQLITFHTYKAVEKHFWDNVKSLMA